MDEHFNGAMLAALTAPNGPLATQQGPAASRLLARIKKAQQLNPSGAYVTFYDEQEATVICDALDAISASVPEAMESQAGIARYFR